jgi:uncharacterized membrane protein
VKRFPAIDVVRGIAVVLMVLHHTVDSWVMEPARHSLAFAWLRQLGGVPAPAFLFLAGLSAALVGAREREKRTPISQRVQAGVKRGLYVLGVAFVFRVFVFYAGSNTIRSGAWPMLFRVDVLNCIGAALILISLVCGPARSPRVAIGLALLLAAVFGLLAPVLAQTRLTVPSEYLGNYFVGSGTLVLFPLFPWMAYLAIGYALGEHVARYVRNSPDAGPKALARATMPLLVLGPLVWIVALRLSDASFSVYPPHDYWHSSPLWVAVRLGVQASLLAVVALVLQRDATGRLAAWLQLLGRHSLLAYTFHVELVYGRVSKSMIRATSIPQALCGVAVLVTLCAVLAAAAEWLGAWRTQRERSSRPLPVPISVMPAAAP